MRFSEFFKFIGVLVSFLLAVSSEAATYCNQSQIPSNYVITAVRMAGNCSGNAYIAEAPRDGLKICALQNNAVPGYVVTRKVMDLDCDPLSQTPSHYIRIPQDGMVVCDAPAPLGYMFTDVYQNYADCTTSPPNYWPGTVIRKIITSKLEVWGNTTFVKVEVKASGSNYSCNIESKAQLGQITDIRNYPFYPAVPSSNSFSLSTIAPDLVYLANQNAAFTFAVKCNQNGQEVENQTLTTTGFKLMGIVPPTLTFGVSATTINYGDQVTLTWSSKDTDSCVLNGVSKALSGSQSSGPLYKNTTYSMTCTGKGGTKTSSSQVTVNPPPYNYIFSAGVHVGNYLRPGCQWAKGYNANEELLYCTNNGAMETYAVRYNGNTSNCTLALGPKGTRIEFGYSGPNQYVGQSFDCLNPNSFDYRVY